MELSQRDIFLIGHIMVDMYCQNKTESYIYSEQCDNIYTVIEYLEELRFKVTPWTDCYKIYREV